MRLNDLKNGMIVTLRYGNECLLLDDKLISNNFRFYSELDNYNDSLTSKMHEQYDIVKVQSFNKVDMLWEQKEVDWNKVLFGTKVKVWDFKDDEICEGKFIRYNDSEDLYKFDVFVKDKESMSWRNCELVEVEVEIPTYGEIDIAFENYCRGQQEGCSKCEIRAENCEIEYILKNYNVIKK